MTRRAALALAGGIIARAADAPVSLFDGKSFAGWSLGDGTEVKHSWTIEDGSIATLAGTTGRSDLLCTKALKSFELSFDFRLSRESNTGVKYFVRHMLRYLYPGSDLTGSYGAIGLEFQLADDSARDVSKPEQKMGALYGILPAEHPVPYKIGDWASARLVCRKDACEHWVNGVRVLKFDPSSAEVRQRFQQAAANPANSIVGGAAAMVAGRGTGGDVPRAFIALQQHNSKAWFRALQARELSD